MRARFMRGVHGFAVGSGIAHTIQASAHEAARESTESWVQFCIKAADEAHAAVWQNPPTVTISSSNDPRMLSLLRMGDLMTQEDHERHGATVTHNAEAYAEKGHSYTRPMDGDELTATADAAAAMAFRCCMPQLTGRRRAQAYFACVAAGLQRGYFKGAEAKAMLHSAQLALNAFPKRQQKPRPARRIGYEQP